MRTQAAIPDAAALEETILGIARLLSPHGQEAADWYSNDPIAALGGATARQLVARGESDRVVRFLLDALRAELIAVLMPAPVQRALRVQTSASTSTTASPG